MDTMLQLALAGFVAFLIERAKNDPRFAWIDRYTDHITKIVAAIVAVASAIGISFMFDSEHGTLTMTGIPTSLEEIASILVMAFEQYWGQKFFYLAAIKPHQAQSVLANGRTVPIAGDDDTQRLPPESRR